MSANLAELTRIAQIALEAHRSDPDDEQLYQDFLREKAARDAAWLAHTMSLPSAK